MIKPDAGQGARKEKSNLSAGGDTEIKPTISGRLIINCIPIHEPNENPAIKVYLE